MKYKWVRLVRVERRWQTLGTEAAGALAFDAAERDEGREATNVTGRKGAAVREKGAAAHSSATSSRTMPSQEKTRPSRYA